MKSPTEAAIAVECVKVAMSQTKDGVKLVLVIHPNDTTNDLFTHPVGSRYQAAFVLLDDENKPVMPKHKTDGERAVVSAGMLCRQPDFQKWMVEFGHTLEASEEAAINGLHYLCGINSRANLRTNKDALQRFTELQFEYSKTRR